MAIVVHVLNATGKLNRVDRQLVQVLDACASPICAYLDVRDMDVTVSPFATGAVPESGIGGHALSPLRIEILLDASRDDLASIVERECPGVLAHEVHHCARMVRCPAPVSLADNLITEGLACHFEEKFNGGHLPSLFKDVAAIPWSALYRQLEPHLHESDFSFDEWFLGAKPRTVPKYAGYWVGYNLVSVYANKHALAYDELVSMPAAPFFTTIS